MANSTLLRFKHTAKTNPLMMRAIANGEIRGAMAYRGVWTQRLKVGEFTGDADGDQTIALHTYNPYNLFPANVWLLPGHHIMVVTDFSGGTVSAATAELGDAGDTDGLVTASDIFTGASNVLPTNTPSAAQYALRFEAAFEPVVRLLTTTSTVAALTAGELEVRINYLKLVDV